VEGQVGSNAAARRNPIAPGYLASRAHRNLARCGGRQLPNTIKLSSDGFAFAMNGLMATCPPAKDPAAPQAVGLPNNWAK
jgi:hypothetical protein